MPVPALASNATQLRPSWQTARLILVLLLPGGTLLVGAWVVYARLQQGPRYRDDPIVRVRIPRSGWRGPVRGVGHTMPVSSGRLEAHAAVA